MNFVKYRALEPIPLTDRLWPAAKLSTAPQWCSLDLCYGNQELIEPLALRRGEQLIDLLIRLGFYEIAFGDITTSEFNRTLLRQVIEAESLPPEISIQLDTTFDEATIANTFVHATGAKNRLIRLCLPTSPRLRNILGNNDKQALINNAILAARLFQEYSTAAAPNTIRFGLCLEDFTATELQFAADVCTAVFDVWQPTAQHKAVLSLPASTDSAPANHYADQIEWMHRHLAKREAIILSLYAANDRETAVAAVELGLLAGGQRVEGTLFGEGERSGCAAIVSLALNMFAQGIAPNLHLRDLEEIIDITTSFSQQPLAPRKPYAGDLAFTTSSEIQRHVLKAGLLEFTQNKDEHYWNIPYVNIDPADIGRGFDWEYEGVDLQHEPAVILEEVYGLHLPKMMQPHFNNLINDVLGSSADKQNPERIKQIFDQSYLDIDSPFSLQNINFTRKSVYGDGDEIHCDAVVAYKDNLYEIHGTGNGAIDTLMNALKTELQLKFDVAGYAQHALTSGSSALAVTYIRIIDKDGDGFWGVGIDSDGTLSSIKALFNAINHSYIPGEPS